ncbi:hypothetical protein JW758_00765 [Candidatus Peregrinibacteria bacterium]|nr:hypothetical protein [Candidatus Peregrinibacteria bacterium]
MKKIVQFTYTDSAKKELKKFQSKQKEIIESIIKNKKYIHGDNFIEITGSDIQDMEELIKISDTNKKNKLIMRKIIISIYLLVGFSMFSIGIFYDYIVEEILNNPIRSMLVLTGFIMIMVSSIFAQIFQESFKKEEGDKDGIDIRN